MYKAAIVLLFFIISVPLVYGESSYQVTVDEHTYDVSYDVDADVLAMEIDEELNSFLIGLDNTSDSVFEIQLDSEMISATDSEFVVLVDWSEVDYELETMPVDDDMINTLRFFVPAGTLEVEIIGTHVIPEFPLGVVAIFAAVMVATIAASRRFNGSKLGVGI